jgi:hypothetical protein
LRPSPLLATNWLGIGGLIATAVGIVATAVVAVVGMVVNRRNQQGDRESREREADAARQYTLELSDADRYFKARLHAYTEAARFLERLRMMVVRYQPILPTAKPPRAPSDEEWETIVATVAVAGSDEVIAAFDDCRDNASEFGAQAHDYKERKDPSAELEGSGIRMQAAREAALDAVDKTLRLMRQELRTLSSAGRS